MWIKLYKNSSILVLIFSVFCKAPLKPLTIDQNISAIAQVLLDVVDEFLIKQHTEFNVNFIESYTEQSLNIFSEFLSKSQQKFKIWVYFHEINENYNIFLVPRPTIFFMKNFENFLLFEEHVMVWRYGNQPLKFIIFAPNLTYLKLKSHWLLKVCKKINVFAASVFMHSYFVTNDDMDIVSLSTIEWYSPHACNHAHVTRLNIFDKKSMQWTSKLRNYDKFMAYYGCELVLMLPAPVDGTIVNYPSGYANVNVEQTNFEIVGLCPIVFQIAATVYNFNVAYQPVEVKKYQKYFFTPEQVELIAINGTSKTPDVVLVVNSINFASRNTKATNTFVDLDVYFVSTPAEAYTPYEKLILPFDLETWVLLIVTFSVTFLVIFIINRLPKLTQQIVYGHKIQNPFWNVVSIFFGIPQSRLPVETFSRFILTLFIYFCLIFRTCYQNKLFEFMTSQPKPQPPKTIEDLIDENYLVLSAISGQVVMSIVDRKKRRLNISKILVPHYYYLFDTQSQNASAKLALYVDEFFQNHFANLTKKAFDWNQLNDILYTSHEAFTFFDLSYFFGMFNIMIDRFIATGIMQNLVEKYYTKKIKFAELQKEPKVLNVDDLAFGFNIWLGVCCLSVVVFIGEIGMRKRKIEKIKFAKIHPILLTDADNDFKIELKLETIEKFRIKKQQSEIKVENIEIEEHDVDSEEIEEIEIDKTIEKEDDLTILEAINDKQDVAPERKEFCV